MLEVVLRLIGEVLIEVVCYSMGRWLLLGATFGRFDARQRNTNDGLVALLGALFLAVTLALIGTWLQA